MTHDQRWNEWRHRLYEAALPEEYDTESVPLDEKWVALRVHVPNTNVEWLVFEYDVYSQRAFAWCDLGVGQGELGWVWMPEVCALDIERSDGVHLQSQIDADFVPRAFGEIGRVSP